MTHINLSFCPNCYSMTKSIRKGRAYFICGKCGEDKTMSDLYYMEYIEDDKTKRDKIQRL